MTFQEQLSAAADKHTTFVNEEMLKKYGSLTGQLQNSFNSGARWALQSELVKSMEDAFETILAWESSYKEDTVLKRLARGQLQKPKEARGDS